MTDRDRSPDGSPGPPRKKLATGQTPEQVRDQPIQQQQEQEEYIVPIDIHYEGVDFGPEVIDYQILGEEPEPQVWIEIEVPEHLQGQPLQVALQHTSPALEPEINPMFAQQLPEDVLETYNNRDTQIEGIDEIDIRILYFNEPNYIIERNISSGAFGNVYSADRNWTENSDKVAVKIMKHGVKSAHSIRMPSERDLVQLISGYPHNNVVNYYQVMQALDDNQEVSRLYLVSELSTIGDLFNAVQRVNSQGIKVWNPVSESAARYLIAGIGSGLLHLKTLGISHSDLKLQNILLFEKTEHRFKINAELDEHRFDRWTPKLCDFGNSRTKRATDPEGSILLSAPVCTFHYSSPEAWSVRTSGRDYDCFPSDVFSLGICLLELLIGAHPFEPPDIQYPRHSNPDFDVLMGRYIVYSTSLKLNTSYIKHLMKQFSPILKIVVLKLLEADPYRRITVEEFLADPWITIPKSLESENVASGPVSGYYGIFPTLKTFKGKDYAKDL